MIKIARGVEPDGLNEIRVHELRVLRGLGRLPSSDDISSRYRDMAPFLWDVQYYKCCYCERRISMSFNDVEHYRPKGAAKRLPGCDKSHGYWWLAYSWENLLYACASCNRSSKKDKFPLAVDSISLSAEIAPPGYEVPLVLDPAGVLHPMEHIQFDLAPKAAGGPVYWWAVPRGGSEFGSYTIDVCNLNRDELLLLRNIHYKKAILPQIEALQREIGRLSIIEINYQYSRALAMVEPDNEFAALSYYAITSAIKNEILQSLIGKSWPEPGLLH